MTTEARLLGLKADVDLRLTDVWGMAWQPGSVLAEVMSDDVTRDAFAGCIRAAYGMGYQDALREDREGRRGELARTHGYSHF